MTSSPGLCGNGILDRAEQCDDDNGVAGDGCDAHCRSELVPGGGPRRSDCAHEWLTSPTPERLPNAFRLPRARLVCHDDDPSCDFGTTAGDGACTFRVASCLNVRERRFVDADVQPVCTATDVRSIVLRSPREAAPRDATDAANRDALETVITGVGATVERACQPTGTGPSTRCTSDADCGPGRRCRARLLRFSPPLTARDRCTAFANIIVPLPHGTAGGPGTRTLRLSVTTSLGTDTDALKLVCRP